MSRRRASSTGQPPDHAAHVQASNSATKDFLLFSQPFIHEGALIASSTSGRRLYIHHLSEVPLSTVFTTRLGNHLQRIDQVPSP